MMQNVPSCYLTYYRRIFGGIILLELLYMTDTIIHVVYENWEPCFVPIFRDWGIPVTHFSIDLALYVGLFCAVFFICDSAIPAGRSRLLWNHVIDVTLFLSYTYLRIIHFYWWNNHYYLNMILLFMFIFIPAYTEGEKRRPMWEYRVIQFFFGTVYFLAGVSKISTAWLRGLITQAMTYNHDLLLPNLILSWGGFLLDLLGGVVILVSVFWPAIIAKKVSVFTHVNFFIFHLHNLLWMFKSIQFFPLHMLFTPLVFVSTSKRTSSKNSSIVKGVVGGRFVLLWSVVVLQALFATRRFFMLVDYPWEIVKANDIAEYHSQVHHFSWRMKSRTCTSMIYVEGRWPMMMSVGIGRTDDEPEQTKYLHYTKVFFNKIYADAEFAIQPLVNRVRKTLPDANPEQVAVRLYWWVEVNQGPFQLFVNPDLNFVGAEHLPLMSGAPPTSHIEPQISLKEEWQDRIASEAVEANSRNLTIAPFVSRAVKSVWIPNPVIGIEDMSLMPKVIVCLEGTVVVRFEGAEVACSKTALALPSDGRFFLKFKTETLFLLAFNK